MVPCPVYRPQLSTPPTVDGRAAPQGCSQPSPAATAYLVLLVLSCTMQSHLLLEAGPLWWRPRKLASTLLGICGRRSRCRTCGHPALRSRALDGAYHLLGPRCRSARQLSAHDPRCSRPTVALLLVARSS